MKRKRKPSGITQERLFIKESKKIKIEMSDGEEITCQYSLGNKTKPDCVLFFIQGFASGYFTWSDCWDAFYKEFNMVIVDPREKLSNELTKRSECTVQRIALDFVEAIEFLKLDEKKIVLFGSSVGASYVAHLVSQKMLKPKGSFITAPARKPRSPRALVNAMFLFPGFVLNSIGKAVALLYLKNKVAEGFQKEILKERIRNVDFRRWKICRQVQDYDATMDFMNIEDPVFLIKTPKDEYHDIEEVEIVQELIPNCKVINVPDYDFTHTKPEVYEFAKILKETILTEM